MTKLSLIFLFIFCFSAEVMADDLTLKTGKILHNYRISRVEPDGIVIFHSAGISKVPLSEMPDSYINANRPAPAVVRISKPDTSQTRPVIEQDSTSKTKQLPNGKTTVTKQLSNGALLSLEYGGDCVYGSTPKDNKGNNDKIIISLGHSIKLLGDETIDNKIAQSQGKQFKVVYKSLRPDIAEISDSGKIQWLNEGTAKFTISAMSMEDGVALGEITIPVTVIRLPISIDMPSVEVVEKLGFPDNKNKKTFEWYDRSVWFEDIYYYFGTADGNSETVVHYAYKKYPDMRIRISPWKTGEPVIAVKTRGWD